jgi:hypothetical protein
LLKISTEDDLFSYLSSRLRSNPEYFDLLQFVQFEYLSADCISDSMSSLPDSIDRRLWESISRRLISRVPPVSPSKSLKCQFPLKTAKSVDGIISHLTGKHGGNVHDKGIVTITSKSLFPGYAERSLVDLTSTSRFNSKNKPCQWVCWDFHEMRVHPTHYTISAWGLKSWVIEGSLDFVNWTEIDRKTDNEDFKYGGTGSFAVSNSAECRFIRLTQTGKNHSGNDYLHIRAVEFFGNLLE